MSSNYELNDKDKIVELATGKNSLKFLNHLWNVQNSYCSAYKKNQKASIPFKENHTKSSIKKLSLLFSDGEVYNPSLSKNGLKLIDIIKLLNKLREHRFYNSIR